MSDEPLKRTPLFANHQALGARLVPFAGWEMPIQYKGISLEHQAVRERAGLFDVSHMGELELRGERALELVNSLITNDIARAADGQATYTCCCNERGTILDDLIVYRRAADDMLVVCNASNRDKISAHFAAAARSVCEFEDISDKTALLALQGPRALDVLKRAGVSLDLGALKTFRFASGTVAGIRCVVARTGYTGEDGVELFCAWDDAVALWDALLSAGSDAGIEPIGLGARDTLRLDARLSLYGNEIDETTNPLEAGLGWVVKFDKPDFIGKAALVRTQRARSGTDLGRLRDDRPRHRAPRLPAVRRRRQRVRGMHLGRPLAHPGQEHRSRLCPSRVERDRQRAPGRLPRQKDPRTDREDSLLQAQVNGQSAEETNSTMSSPKEVKEDRKYTKDHEWARTEGSELLVGITAFAVDALGDITLVSLDVKVGDSVSAGKTFGTIESVKTLSDLFAPVSGKITRINGALENNPELINEDSWGKGWMIAIAPDAGAGELMDAESYANHLSHSDH